MYTKGWYLNIDNKQKINIVLILPSKSVYVHKK